MSYNILYYFLNLIFLLIKVPFHLLIQLFFFVISEIISIEVPGLAIVPIGLGRRHVPVPHEVYKAIVLPLLLCGGNVSVVHNPAPSGGGGRILEENVVVAGKRWVLTRHLIDLVHPLVVVGGAA